MMRHAAGKLLLISCVAAAAAFSTTAPRVPNSTQKLAVDKALARLRGGTIVDGTPLSPLELIEAVMGTVYWIQIALLPQAWSKLNMGLELDAQAASITALLGALLFNLRALILLVRVKAPQLKKDVDLFSAIGWAYCCSVLFMPGNEWGPGFIPNFAICGGFTLAYALRFFGVF